MSELYRRTLERQRYLEDREYRVVCIWECQYKHMRKADENLPDFCFSHKQEPNGRSVMSVEQILSAIRSGTMFCVVRCVIRVPDDKKDKFSEMCLVFKNVDIPFGCIGEHMQQFVNDNSLNKNPKRGLIGSMFGDNIIWTTPLLKWYLEHGLAVTEVYEVLDYTPNSCFQTFADNVSNARRADDADPSKAIIAETCKLHGKSAYGTTRANKETHLHINYCDESAVGLAVNDPHFRKLDNVDDNFYEISRTKKSIKLNLSMQTGFFVNQYAKLRMPEFYFDCIDKFLDVAFFGETIYALVRPELKADYELEKFNWFPRNYNAEVKAYDKRTPGLFKTEYLGDGIIGLNSKMYFCFNDSKAKFSCKGVNKHTNSVNKDTFLNVIQTKATGHALQTEDFE